MDKESSVHLPAELYKTRGIIFSTERAAILRRKRTISVLDGRQGSRNTKNVQILATSKKFGRDLSNGSIHKPAHLKLTPIKVSPVVVFSRKKLFAGLKNFRLHHEVKRKVSFYEYKPLLPADAQDNAEKRIQSKLYEKREILESLRKGWEYKCPLDRLKVNHEDKMGWFVSPRNHATLEQNNLMYRNQRTLLINTQQIGGSPKKFIYNFSYKV